MAKICKGTGKALGFGCGNPLKSVNPKAPISTYIQKYGLCPTCQSENKKGMGKQKPISKVSKKRVGRNKVYLSLREIYLRQHTVCEINGTQGTEVHHTYSGKNREKYMLDTTTWMAVSREGHNRIHDNPKWSYSMGYLKSE